MKTLLHKSILAVCLLTATCSFAQVGIGTSSPKGALDLDSSTNGVVFPVVSLPDLTTETIVNPNGPNIVAGTTIYNTSTVNNGANSVYPGIYFWNGSRWISQREKRDNKLFLQNADRRTGSDDILNPIFGDQTIGFDSNIFTPIYTGKYAVHLILHYGGGSANNPSGNQRINMAKQEGVYKFNFNGTTHTINLSTFSVINDDRNFDGGTLKNYSNSFNQTAYDLEENLVSGVPYVFSLTFNQAFADAFEGNGDITIIPAGDGRGYITINGNMKCSIEINYIGE